MDSILYLGRSFVSIYIFPIYSPTMPNPINTQPEQNHIESIVSIRSTPYCISQNNIVTLHGDIIFLNLRQEYKV